MIRLRRPHISLASFGARTSRCISLIPPNPTKIAVVSQYPKNTFDFSFLPDDYSVQFLELDRIQSEAEFVEALKGIEKDRVVLNLIDNCEDSANETPDRYISSTDAEKLAKIKHAEKNNLKLKKQKPAKQLPQVKETYYKVCGLTAIAWYNRLDLAYTGASAYNFATRKTDLKMQGVPTPRHVVVRDRNLTEWQVQFRQSAKLQQSVKRINQAKQRRFPLKFPVIVKPLKDYGGSTFIREKMKCSNMVELEERVAEFPVQDMIIEEFIVGEEYAAFIFEKIKGTQSIPKVMRNLRELEHDRGHWLRKIATRVVRKNGLPREQIEEQCKKLTGKLAQELDKHGHDNTRPAERPCTVADPIQVILPSPDSFQHEEMKWRLVNSSHEKMRTGKTCASYLMSYRMVPQELFLRSFEGGKKENIVQKEIIALLRSLRFSITNADKPISQIVRDAYLHAAIEKAARKAWKILKHDGYFRYDLRVVEKRQLKSEKEPCLPSSRDLRKISLKKLLQYLPRYEFKVHIVDANPYCSLYGIPASYDEADSMLIYTPTLSHRQFTKDMITAGIARELNRRAEQYKLEKRLLGRKEQAAFTEKEKL